MSQENKKYLQFGKYTADYPQELLDKIKALHLWKINEDSVNKIFELIRQEFDPKLYKVNMVNDFAISRFTSAKDVYNKRQRSCGSLATLLSLLI
ncbi:MAG: hypothetical protein PHO91_01230 [Patescibacteria group bacterium]|nr:hypothetical protein [Patescibacteria group bacterium]